jgi:hypothetical protein
LLWCLDSHRYPVGGVVTFSNIKYAQEGSVQVVTKWGAIERIYAPSDGWFTTIAPGRKSYEVNVKSFTETRRYA